MTIHADRYIEPCGAPPIALVFKPLFILTAVSMVTLLVLIFTMTPIIFWHPPQP